MIAFIFVASLIVGATFGFIGFCIHRDRERRRSYIEDVLTRASDMAQSSQDSPNVAPPNHGIVPVPYPEETVLKVSNRERKRSMKELMELAK